MSKVKPEHYKVAYDKLYAFLRYNHPEILKEYKQKLQDAKEVAEALVLLGKDTNEKGES